MTDLIKRGDALLPCPFCGGEAEMSNNLVSCWGCLCVVPNGHGYEGESLGYDTKAEAIAAWNTRALPAIDPAPAKQVTLSEAEAIREAALREAANVAKRGVDILGGRMRDAKDKKEKRDWQSMLFAAVDIKDAILALIGETK